MSSKYSDARKTARALRKKPGISTRPDQKLFGNELCFLHDAQNILIGQVPSLRDIKTEDQQLRLLTNALWYAYEDDGPPEFWKEYDALVESHPFLLDWKSSIDPLLFPFEPESPSTNSKSNKASKADQSKKPGVLLSQATLEAVEWLWKLVFPLGKLTLLDGDPGTGKSLLLCDIAARLTRGEPMPDGMPGLKGGVVIIAPEDGINDTILPRLARAGADLEQIVCLNMVDETEGDDKTTSKRPFLLTQDLDLLEAAIERVQAKMLIIDPLMAVLGRSFSQRDGDIRAGLAPLQQLVERLHIACVLVRHLTKKGSENVLYRGSGSIALLALARCGLITAPDPADARPYIRWEGPSPITARHLCSPLAAVTELRSGRKLILTLLKEHGTNGLTPQQIAEKLPELGMSNLHVTLRRMVEERQISQPKRGIYALISA